MMCNDLLYSLGASSNTMVIGSGFEQQHRMDSSPILTSSGGGTPTPTSSSNSVPQPQAPTNTMRSGPSGWIKQQVQAIGAHVLPSSGPSLHLDSQTRGHDAKYTQDIIHRQHQKRALTSQEASMCASDINQETRIRRDSPDEGIQVESDV